MKVIIRHDGVLPEVAKDFGCSLRVVYAWLKKLGLQEKAQEIRQAYRNEKKAKGEKIFEMRPRAPKPDPETTAT